MTGREPRTIRVDPQLWQEFEEYVSRRDGGKQGAKSQHLETALEEYLNADRHARIEDMVSDLHTHLLDDDPDTHTQTHTGTSATVERTRQIARRIIDNHDAVVKEADVHRAIKDIAGGDPRTVEKYEAELKQRGLLWEHPSDSAVWTSERDEWVQWVENYVSAVPDARIDDIIAAYPYDSEADYDEVAAEVTADD